MGWWRSTGLLGKAYPGRAVGAGHSSAGDNASGGLRQWAAHARAWPPTGDTWGMGFNPYRPQRRRRSDYVFVVAAFVVMAALLVWAFL